MDYIRSLPKFHLISERNYHFTSTLDVEPCRIDVYRIASKLRCYAQSRHWFIPYSCLTDEYYCSEVHCLLTNLVFHTHFFNYFWNWKEMNNYSQISHGQSHVENHTVRPQININENPWSDNADRYWYSSSAISAKFSLHGRHKKGWQSILN